MGKTLYIYSPKGGVGKTTLALNLAGIASKKGLSVLLMDLDMVGGGISMLIDEDINKTIFQFIDDATNNRFSSVKDYVYKYNENIDILCAPKDPRQGNKISSRYVELVLERVHSFYDIILLDSSSVLDDINVVTLDIADLILFVLTNDAVHLKNLRNIISIFKDNEMDNFKVLLNMSNDFKDPYYSVFDMEKIIASPITYTLTHEFFIKNITSYIINNKIPILENNVYKKSRQDTKTLEKIIEDFTFKEDTHEKEK